MTETTAGVAQGMADSAAHAQRNESVRVDPGEVRVDVGEVRVDVGEVQVEVGELRDAAKPVQDLDRLVRILAGRVLAGLPRDCGIEMADLIQAGNLGLLQAERTFSPQNGAPMAGYAKFRIRGEMLDTVRRNSGPGRSTLPQVHGFAGEGSADLESTLPAPAEHSPHSLLAANQRAAILGEEV